MERRTCALACLGTTSTLFCITPSVLLTKAFATTVATRCIPRPPHTSHASVSITSLPNASILQQILDEHSPRSAQTGSMAPSRTRKEESDGPSTAEVSANEDVEMQDQEDRVNGFKKFGVSGHRQRRDRPGESHDAQQHGLQQTS
jgi:hypothetical protein